MNVGQILKTHLGWAAEGLGLRIGEMLDAQREIAEVRKFLDKIYNKSGRQRRSRFVCLMLISFSWQAIFEAVCRWQRRVFDGANEEEIKAMLTLRGCRQMAKRLLLMVAPASSLIGQ